MKASFMRNRDATLLAFRWLKKRDFIFSSTCRSNGMISIYAYDRVLSTWHCVSMWRNGLGYIDRSERLIDWDSALRAARRAIKNEEILSWLES